MRICLFADIHGNGPAFSMARAGIVSEGADLNIFLGDLCGYYFDQGSILPAIQSLPNFIAICGNHDRAALRILGGDEVLRRDYRARYGPSMERLVDGSDKNLERWLSGLPESYCPGGLDLACYHGSPWDPLEGYIYPDGPVDLLASVPYSVILLGHTHYSMVKTVGDKLIVNPGSLGQPRDGGWPTYAVLDLEKRAAILKEVVYDKDEFLGMVERLGGGNEYLTSVIRR